MKVEDFLNIIDADFFTGVPDSLLKSLNNYLMKSYGNNTAHHIIAANEGTATSLAAGYYLSTKKIPVVYMQNSGEGNAVNPICSLLSDKVYGIPIIFVIGWRGEPNVKDEPQHAFQGIVTLKLLETLDIKYFVIGKETSVEEMKNAFQEFKKILSEGKQVAFVVQKDSLTYDGKVFYANDYKIIREEAIKHILKFSENDVIVSTTGKISRELYFAREVNNFSHNHDFLTVGSMGHASSIALGIAIQKTSRKVWCIDGDGALLMHLGAMTSIGAIKPKNLVHIVLNNSAHESVGGLPTAADSVNLPLLAKACNYSYVASADTLEKLNAELSYIQSLNELSFLEVKVALNLNSKVGRPYTTPQENKTAFMKFLSDK